MLAKFSEKSSEKSHGLESTGLFSRGDRNPPAVADGTRRAALMAISEIAGQTKAQ
jgi:hypothetical protein